MNRLFSILSFLAVYFFSNIAFSYNIPPRPDGPVYDGANALSPQQEENLAKTLISFHETKGATVVVAVIPTLGNETIEQVANDIFNGWGIGNAEKNDGVLLLIVKDKAEKAGKGATKCGCIRIEVGKYLEGDLPDSLVYNILKTEVLSEAVQGHFYTASVKGSNAIISVLEGTSQGKYEEVGVWDSIPLFWQVVIIILVIVFVLYIIVIGGGGSSSRGYYSGSSSWGSGGSSGGSFGGFGGGSSGGGGASL